MKFDSNFILITQFLLGVGHADIVNLRLSNTLVEHRFHFVSELMSYIRFFHNNGNGFRPKCRFDAVDYVFGNVIVRFKMKSQHKGEMRWYRRWIKIVFLIFDSKEEALMNTADLNVDLVNNYFAMLKHLNKREKTALIAKLTHSMHAQKAEKGVDWEDLFGSLKLDEPAEDFIAGLKQDRNFKRKTLDL